MILHHYSAAAFEQTVTQITDWASRATSTYSVVRTTSWMPLNTTFLRVSLEPIAFSDEELAEAFYAGVEVV